MKVWRGRRLFRKEIRIATKNRIMAEQYKDRFISILSDYGFKATFGNESDTRFLRKALQALIKSEIAIEKVSFTQNEMKGLTFDSRSGIYDISCIDENGNSFIVEMQLSEYPEFIQRMKFYALYKFNTFVKKGDYTFQDLPKIYCIGILAKDIFSDVSDYHNVAVLRNEKGELIDDQMTFISVELNKFDLSAEHCNNDLEKLIFTMKNLNSFPEPIQYPQFWDEEWLKIAIKELDTKAMSPEERLIYEMTVSANALAIQNEKRKIEKAVLLEKIEAIKKALEKGKLTIQEIAEYNNVSETFVLDVQKGVS
ncbi:MAG: Rpn family recombination-promoting nuclease/putative transposase [Arcicella sp.]|jgi:predicted transposase/invertase (TIGR01784 family)|nr:Rpn family recombination-promoting nuclease/putative transposase [Arcicella sp.]